MSRRPKGAGATPAPAGAIEPTDAADRSRPADPARLADLARDPRAAGGDLVAFLDAAPTPFHAVAEVVRRLEAAGFSRLDERERWTLSAGDRRYVVRDGGSVVAVRVGRQAPSDAGFRLVGAHTDSPTFRVRPTADVRRFGQHLVGVEVYGGPLAHTWMDRDLTVAGRVAVRAHDGAEDGAVDLRLVRLEGAPLRMPSLAIHLDRDVARDGVKLNPQQHLVPVWGGDRGDGGGFLEAVAGAAGVDAREVLAHDLVLVDAQPPALAGRDDAWVVGARQDDLACVHAGVLALLGAEDGGLADATQVLVANDHEEVGSGSAEGARGPFLEDALRRVAAACDDVDPQAFARAAARSLLVSADMAHAVHPSYADRHEPEHRPVLGGGPVVKANANQAYATDAATAAAFVLACAEAGVPVQRFVTRGDLPCGSTIGPLTATRLGIPAVDVGNPLWGMHSVRETTAASDVALMAQALAVHLAR